MERHHQPSSNGHAGAPQTPLQGEAKAIPLLSGVTHLLSGHPGLCLPAGISPRGSKNLSKNLKNLKKPFKEVDFPGIPHGPDCQTQKQLSPGAEEPSPAI